MNIDVRNRHSWITGISLAVMVALLVVSFSGTASARRIVGRDGKVHACYRVKGKPKGALRLVHKRARCHRGERKVAWFVFGAVGGAGPAGQQGATGTGPGVNAALAEQVGLLTTKVEKLQATLAGVTNADLLALIDSLPTIDSLCKRSEDLTEQASLLQDAVGGLGLSPGLEALGLLEIPALPEPLEPFSCPAP